MAELSHHTFLSDSDHWSRLQKTNRRRKAKFVASVPVTAKLAPWQLQTLMVISNLKDLNVPSNL